MSGGSPVAIWIFTVASLSVWLMTLVWAMRQGRQRSVLVSLLILTTAFWWVGETLAIRLGKYDYGPFPGFLVLPGGGPVNLEHDFIRLKLVAFLGWFFTNSEIDVAGCWPTQRSWNIPFPVIALEAALLFSFIRLSLLWLKTENKRTAFAAAGASGFLMTNVTAVLDPVVSTTQWCGATSALLTDPALSGGLHLGIWHWYTNSVHVGYWFGVPLINYVAWFVAAAVFSFVIRLDDDGPRGLFRRYERWFGYLWPVIFLIVAFALLLPIKVGADKLLIHGQDFLFAKPIFTPPQWQFGVIAALNGLALVLVFGLGRFRHHSKCDWFAAVVQGVVFAYCLGALLFEPNNRILAVWGITTVIASVAVLWPRFEAQVRQLVANNRTAGVPHA
jgi:hypothetical protein